MTKTFKEFLNESSLGRVHQHIQGRNIGIITAHRHDDTKTEEENTQHNNERNKQLKHDIRSHGYGYIKVKGHYTENKGTPQEKKVQEHSFIVVAQAGKKTHEKLKNFMIKHGEKYHQDAVLMKKHNEDNAKLIGTSHKKDSWIKHGEEHDVGKFHANRAGEMHTKIRNHTFNFSEGLEDVQFVYDYQRSFFNRGPEHEIEY